MRENQFIGMLFAHGIQFIIEKHILRNRLMFLNFDVPFIITFYFPSIQNIWDGFRKIAA